MTNTSRYHPAQDATDATLTQVSGFQSPLLAGLCIGLSLFWAVAAVLSNKAILQRWPKLVEWMPFLEHSHPYASAEQLTGSFVKGQQFRIAMLSIDGEIHDRVFEDCVIYGPAVLVFSEYCDAKECSWEIPAPHKDMHWVFEFEKDKTSLSVIPCGVIVVKKCIFKRCRFVGVGFIGNKESVEDFKTRVTFVDKPPDSAPVQQA